MERLRRTILIMGAVFIALGVSFQLRGATKVLHDGKVPDEKWLEGIAPREVGPYKMMILDQGPDCTYKMSESTYTTLRPYGIVARVMDDGEQRFDTVVIMSNLKDSFHDPKFCFTSQGWELNELTTVPIQTRSHGKIEVTMASMVRDSQKNIAVYFYKGPEGFTPSNTEIKMQMLRHQLMKFQDGEGVFYRFIPLHDNATKEQLAAFIDKFLEASEKSSKGLL